MYFWVNLVWKTQNCSFCLKIGTHDISRMIILIPTLVFWFPILTLFWGNLCEKKWKLSVLTENWHTWYIEDADSYSDISFLNFQSQIYFWVNLGRKNQSCQFCLKIGTHGFSTMLILILTLVLWVSNPKSIFLFVLPENWHTWYLKYAISYSNISFLNFEC